MATAITTQRDRSRSRFPDQPREPSPAHLALSIHAGVAGSMIVTLAVINALVDRSTWWVLWVAWAWGMLLALQAGLTFRWHGYLGAHALVSGLFSAGIVGTNLALGGATWWPWVVVAVSAPLIGHWLMVRRGMPVLAAQAIASGILLLEVVTAQLLYPSGGWGAGFSIAGAMLTLSLLMACTVILTGRRSS